MKTLTIFIFAFGLAMMANPVWAAEEQEANLLPAFHPLSTPNPDDARERDFERWNSTFFNPKNYYTWDRARADFNGDRIFFWASGLAFWENRGRVVQDAEQGKVLRVKYPAGEFGSANSGVSFPWVFKGEYEELFLTYRVMFQQNFAFTTSGKLPGLCGANDTMGCFRYTGGNKPKGDDGFSVRPVWLNAQGLLGSYVYHANQQGTYGDIFPWQYPGGQDVYAVPGQWHTIQLRVKLNDPGIPNGEVEAWFDGKAVSLVTGFLFRDGSDKGREIRINEMYFNTFHGGNDSHDAPPQTQYSFFDDFRLGAGGIAEEIR